MGIGSGLLALFRTETIQNVWVILIGFWWLYAAGEGLIYLIGKRRGAVEPVYTEEEKRENWRVVREKGRFRHMLRYVLLFLYGGSWGAVGVQILFWDFLSFFIPVGIVLGYGIWGYVEGANEWKRNIEQYSEPS